MSGTVSVLAVLKARPGAEERMRERTREMAAASREEPGCLGYRNYVDPEDPASWVVVEEWADRASLDAHLASPHLARSLELASELLAEPPAVRILTDLD